MYKIKNLIFCFASGLMYIHGTELVLHHSNYLKHYYTQKNDLLNLGYCNSWEQITREREHTGNWSTLAGNDLRDWPSPGTAFWPWPGTTYSNVQKSHWIKIFTLSQVLILFVCHIKLIKVLFQCRYMANYFVSFYYPWSSSKDVRLKSLWWSFQEFWDISN